MSECQHLGISTPFCPSCGAEIGRADHAGDLLAYLQKTAKTKRATEKTHTKTLEAARRLNVVLPRSTLINRDSARESAERFEAWASQLQALRARARGEP